MGSYNVKWLTEKFYAGDQLSYVFFWENREVGDDVRETCLSQWYALPFTVNSKVYKTAEHWMMANKALLFEDHKTYEKILNADTPKIAKMLGREVIGFDEMIWSEHAYEIVVRGNIHKFNAHKKYADYLLNTDDAILVEASPVDKIWGIGLAKDHEDATIPSLWEGQNLLGFALMEVRDFLRDFGHFEPLKTKMLTPWQAYPAIDSSDMFWRMGKEEMLMLEFSAYFEKLTEREKTIFKLNIEDPLAWINRFE